MITPEAAWDTIERSVRALSTVRMGRREAVGRTLAAPLHATTPVPPCDVSALDGYAYSGDLTAGAELAISATIAAGDPPGARLEPGTAATIWTGAPIPEGADRVVGIEQTERLGPDRLRLDQPARAANAVRRQGEIVVAGEPLLERGRRLGPAAMALLASQGIDSIDVYRPPRVAVLATGDEVVSPDLEPAPGQLRDSHTDYLLAAGRRLGLAFVPLGIAPDDPHLLERWIARGVESADVTLVCGGVSMGGRDHTEGALAALGFSIRFTQVAVQPGKPLVFAERGDRWLFGLPGNPASVMVSFQLFVRPALARLEGRAQSFWDEARRLVLAAALPAGKGRDRFVPARLSAGRAEPLEPRGSHDLLRFGAADLLLRVRAGDPARREGDEVEAVDWE